MIPKMKSTKTDKPLTKEEEVSIFGSEESQKKSNEAKAKGRWK